MVKNRKTRKKVWLIPVFVILFLLLAAVIVGVILMWPAEKKIEEEETYTGIPTMHISLGETTLEEINNNDKDIKYPNNSVELFYGKTNLFYDNVEIKGRGNFSWLADKKSYRIKFDNKVDLLGMGKKRKWALVANSVDSTLMRNDLAYYLAEITSVKHQLRGEFVNLIVDEEDLGVYYLIKTAEIDKKAIDLRDPYGVMIELDNAYCHKEENRYETNGGDCLVVKDIVAEDNLDAVMKNFVGDFNAFLSALKKKDSQKIEDIIDLESFVRYYLVSELTANPDAYVTSWYMYKDGYDDKIHAGPMWDFDAAFGNYEWGGMAEGFYEPTTMMGRFEYFYEKKKGNNYCQYDRTKPLGGGVSTSWVMCDLLEVPEFRELANEIYLRDFRGKREQLISHINEVADRISEAAKRDAEIWGKNDFDDAVKYLIDWVNKRFDVFDELFMNNMENLIDKATTT